MPITLIVTEVEAYDSDGQALVFRVRAFDEAAAEVSLPDKHLTTAKDWQETAKAIGEAIAMLKLEG